MGCLKKTKKAKIMQISRDVFTKKTFLHQDSVKPNNKTPYCHLITSMITMDFCCLFLSFAVFVFCRIKKKVQTQNGKL